MGINSGKSTYEIHLITSMVRYRLVGIAHIVRVVVSAIDLPTRIIRFPMCTEIMITHNNYCRCCDLLSVIFSWINIICNCGKLKIHKTTKMNRFSSVFIVLVLLFSVPTDRLLFSLKHFFSVTTNCVCRSARLSSILDHATKLSNSANFPFEFIFGTHTHTLCMCIEPLSHSKHG